MRAISGRMGMNAETLRHWVRQAEVDQGQAAGVTTESAKEVRELEAQGERAGADDRGLLKWWPRALFGAGVCDL